MKKLLLLAFCGVLLAAEGKKPNILFIAIDDMNDWSGFLDGHPQAKTPHMDALAAKGVSFSNAHTAVPGCSPSRNAIMLGKQPFTTGLYPFYDYGQIYNGTLKNEITLPQHFKKSGYDTFGCGKIHHGSEGNAPPSTHDEWTENRFVRRLPELICDFEKGYQANQSGKMNFCPTTNPLADHPDYDTAQYGTGILQRNHDAPFKDLGNGFWKAELPSRNEPATLVITR